MAIQDGEFELERKSFAVEGDFGGGEIGTLRLEPLYGFRRAYMSLCNTHRIVFANRNSKTHITIATIKYARFSLLVFCPIGGNAKRTTKNKKCKE